MARRLLLSRDSFLALESCTKDIGCMNDDDDDDGHVGLFVFSFLPVLFVFSSSSSSSSIFSAPESERDKAKNIHAARLRKGKGFDKSL